MTTKEVLIAARKRIEKPDRWGQGYEINRGKECPAIAIDCAASVLGEEYVRVRADCCCVFSKAINESYREANGYILPIPTWNDQPNRRHEDVLKVFDRAIELA